MAPPSTAEAFDKKYGQLVASEHPDCHTAYLLRKALLSRTPSIDVSADMLKVWFSKYRVAESLTAQSFDEKYGQLVATDHSDCQTPYKLRRALLSRKPSINVTEAMLKVWFSKYRVAAGTVKIGSVDELQTKCAEYLPSLAVTHNTAYKLQRALLTCEPPVSVSEGILKVWLNRYFDCRPIDSAGHLELEYGDIIRESCDTGIDAEDLRVWLRSEQKVDVSLRTCTTWLSREWSSANKLMSIVDIEEAIGERLRLSQYSECFKEDTVGILSQQFSEGQPPVYLSTPSLLMQWYSKYHPGQ